MFARLKKTFLARDHGVGLEVKPASPEPVYGEPRAMTGLFAGLTVEQKQRALAYRGPDWQGDLEAKHR